MEPLKISTVPLLDLNAEKINVSSFSNETWNCTGGEVLGVPNLLISVVYIIVCVIGLSGNSLVIYVVLRYAKMKTVTNVYILNLAVADELYMLGLPFLATNVALSNWPFGSFMCRLVLTVDAVTQFTSIFCLTVMSIDRYLAVVHPIRSTKWRKPRVAKMINATVWTSSVVVVLPVIIYSEVQKDLNTCNIDWPEPKSLWSTAFIIYTATLGFFGPLLVICLCYLMIVVKVKSSRLRVGSTKRRKSEKKATRMVIVIVAVFVFCWMPFYVLNIVNTIVILPEKPIFVRIYFFGVILSYANSCANPVLYCFLSDNFKKSFQKVLCLCKSNSIQDADRIEQRHEKTHFPDTCTTQRLAEPNGHIQTSQL